MSNERYSYIEYVCDGSTTTFQIPFNYIEQDDIIVYVDGIESAYTYTTENTIELATAPANGIIVRVSRLTDADIRSVDFRDGSILTEADLDTSAQQIFNVAQEAMDTARDAVTVTADGRVNAQGRQIKGVADPSAPDHAVNLDFIQTEYPNVTAVKANQSNINVVSNNTSNINVVSSNIADVNTVAADIGNVNTVAGHVPTLDANYTAINTVANNIADVATLSAQIDGVLQVAASFATQETQPTTQAVGDRWFQPSTATLYIKGEDGSYYEAAIYQSVRHYQWKTIGGAKTTLSGLDSNGNTVYIPPKGHTVVTVDGFTLSQGEDYTITGTSAVSLLATVAVGSTIDLRVFTPVLTDEYTWFETNKNTTLGYMNTANAHKTAAETARTGAETAQAAAAASQAGALASEGLANTYKNDASASKTASANSATQSANSATAAAASATAAANSAASAARNDMDTGSASNAGLAFLGDTNTGFYQPATDSLAITTGGAQRLLANSSGITVPTITVSGAATVSGNLNVTGHIFGNTRGHAIKGEWYGSNTDYSSSSTTTFYGPTITFTPSRTSGGVINIIWTGYNRQASTGRYAGIYSQIQYMDSAGAWQNLGEDMLDAGYYADGGTNYDFNITTVQYAITQSSSTINAGSHKFRIKHHGYGNSTTSVYTWRAFVTEHDA